jgi:N-acetylmuramoyl-L-alanine amidase
MRFSWLAALIVTSAIMANAQPASTAVPRTPEARDMKEAGRNISIQSKPIDYGAERVRLTIEYRRSHQDPKADSVEIQPKMIILHWTAIDSFASTWSYFNHVKAESARPELAAAGEVNVSAHFLVDRDGTIYQLMPETWMARHCIGLNHLAIGVENVGDGSKYPLTEAQVKADAELVRYLKGKYPITHLIGHMEYRRMEGTPLFLELDPKYRNNKPDPGAEFMSKVRTLVRDLNLQGAPATEH